MSRDVLLSLLRQGSTGEQILQILDTITSGVSVNEPAAEPTADPIEF